MIHKLLNLIRPLVALDTETTGLNVAEDRIVELALQVWTSEGLQLEERSLIDPTVPILARTTEVHVYTDAQMRGCRVCGGVPSEHPRAKVGEAEWMSNVFDLPSGEPDPTVVGAITVCKAFKPVPTFRQVAPKLAALLSNCDFLGKNVRFDLRVLASEFARAGVAWSYAGARVIDADRLEALLNPRDLGTLYEKYTGEKLEGAHGALADVKGVLEVVCGQLGGARIDQLSTDLDALHALSWPNFVDTEGRFKFDGSVSVISFGKHAGKPMRDVPRDYWDWILTKSDFSAEVRAIAADAKFGRFPERANTKTGQLT